MFEVFYLVEVREGWYRLHIKDTHYCLGATHDLSALLGTVKRLVKKYRTKDRLLKALSQMEDKGRVSEKTFEVYSTQYESLHHYFDGQVKSTVKEALEEVKQDSTFNKVKKRLRPVCSTGVTTKTTTRPEEVTQVIENRSKVIAKRPKVVKRGLKN